MIHTYPSGSVASWYGNMETDRECFLERAREASKLTIPFLVPEDGTNPEILDAHQSDGARGVNNLASKLLLALFPPNTPNFKLTTDRYKVDEELEGADEDAKEDIRLALRKVEKAVVDEYETNNVRVHAFEGLRQLIVSGNVLFHVPKKGDIRVYKLPNYVIKRDPSGNVQKIAVKETIASSDLPEVIKSMIPETDFEKNQDLYTCIQKNPESNRWDVWQEVYGKEIPGTRGHYPLDKSPWIPVRFNKVDGEDYGYGYVEEYMGDLYTLEGLTQAIKEASAAAARVIFLVRSGATARPKVIEKLPNGGFTTGDAEDITTLQLDKQADLQVALQVRQEIRESLAKAFLLNSSVQRSGERVTAEEIRFMAQELEDALGGIYSILSTDLSLPLVNVMMDRMSSQGRLPSLPKDLVKPQIVTGIDALGRGHDLNRLQSFLSLVVETLGPEGVSMYIDPATLIKRYAAATSIDDEGLLKSPEEIAQAQQQQQLQAYIEKLGPNAITQGGQLLQNQQAPEQA